ncbi:MAG: calcium/sodium antiporter [Victivallales bacterium]|nr:calcium/sodium antiporter [bacterium]MDY5697765.1 calcium/sodium antiporter [Victivallales bacterium]
MNTVLQIAAGIAGLVLLCYGADFLVRGGVQIAKKFKVTPLVIGLTLVALATSAPELVVGCDAALQGAGDIALGNVIGSNICNIALILGLSALITPLRVNPNLFKLDVPLMLGASVLLAFFLWLSGGLNRLEGAVFFAGIIAYMAYSVHAARKSGEEVTEIEGDGKPLSIAFSIGLVLLGLAMLVGGAKLLVGSAVWLAQLLGVTQAVIGLTIVAVGTSLPELATSVVAALKGERDIAIGNVVGSNIFNILAILGAAPILKPLKAANISPTDLAVMLFCAAVLYPIMKTGLVISRKEGAFLLLVYIGYTVWLIIG